jgi:hypothetical protein
MSEYPTPGSSMGMQYDEAALETGISEAEHEIRLIEKAFSNEVALYTAFDKYQGNEELTPQEAGLVAEVHSMVAFLHVIQFSDRMVARDPEGQIRNWGSCTYRVKDFYRMMEYLRLTGVVRNSVLESNKLVLGIGPVLSDVYPLLYQFEVTDIRSFNPNEFRIRTSEEARNSFQQYLDSGIIAARQRAGQIVGVDNDAFLLDIGNAMMELLGITAVRTYCENARGYVNNNLQSLKKANIGLILGARIDPLLVGGDSTFKADWIKRITKFTENLAAIATAAKLSETPGRREKGQIVLSIGSGKRGRRDSAPDYHTWEEYTERTKALNTMKSTLTRMGILFHQDMTRNPVTAPWLQPTTSDLIVMVANAGKRSF